jgi:hypothetical protein
LRNQIRANETSSAPLRVDTRAPASVVVRVDLVVRADVVVAERDGFGAERVELEDDLGVVHHVAVLDAGVRERDESAAFRRRADLLSDERHVAVDGYAHAACASEQAIDRLAELSEGLHRPCLRC